jgi:hypothetical protein
MVEKAYSLSQIYDLRKKRIWGVKSEYARAVSDGPNGQPSAEFVDSQSVKTAAQGNTTATRKSKDASAMCWWILWG